MQKQWADKTRGGPSVEGCAVRNISKSRLWGTRVIVADLLRAGEWTNAVFYRDGKYAGMDIDLHDRSLDLVEVQHDPT